MKNVLHAIDVFESGGAETVFLQLIKNINRAEYNPVVIIPGKGWLYQQLVRLDIEPIIVDMQGSFNLAYLKSLLRIIKEEKIDLIHSHLFGSNIYCSITGWLSQVPVISTFHGVIDVAEDERFLFLKKRLLRLGSSKIVFVSQFLKDALNQRINAKESLCQVIYNGVDLEQFAEPITEDFRQKIGTENKTFVSMVGNVNHSKGYDILIETAALLRGKGYVFVVAGDTSDECFGSLKRELESQSLEQDVIFLGFQDNIRDLIKSSALYLLTSRDEGFSISTIEAMASGIPVIATRSGGPEEIIQHESNGLLVENENPLGIASAIEALITNPKIAAKMTEQALKDVSARFSIDKIIRQYENLYASLVK